MSTKPFASSADLVAKQATLEQLADGVYAYTAQGDAELERASVGWTGASASSWPAMPLTSCRRSAARGLNSGVAAAENQAWKLALVVRGDAPTALVDTYDAERRPAALDNLAATGATTRFMAPHGPIRRAWRDLVLRMAHRSAWFQKQVDSGRLAAPAVYPASSIVAAGQGTVAPDVPLPDRGRLRTRIGYGYEVVVPSPTDLHLPSVVVGQGSADGDMRVWLVGPDGYTADSRLLARAGGVWEAMSTHPRPLIA